MRLDRTWSGNIDELAPFFEEAVPADQDVELWINLQGVTLINSIGVMRWMRWSKALPPRVRLFVVNCPLQVVSQAALVDGFFPPGATVQSFRALYFCENCSEEKVITFEKGREYFYPADAGQEEPKIQMPEVSCPKCGRLMDPDFSGTRTFAFLKASRQR